MDGCRPCNAAIRDLSWLWMKRVDANIKIMAARDDICLAAREETHVDALAMCCT